jgi:ribonuclease HII
MQNEYFEYITHQLIAGVDEAGRDCIAGPVIAATVIFPKNFRNSKLKDSNKLTEKAKYQLVDIIRREAISFSVGIADNKIIDQIDISESTIQAMNDAVNSLSIKPNFLLINGNQFKSFLGFPYQCIVGGNDKYYSIAAASLIAKTYRDNYMRVLSEQYPQYGWDKNSGYLTKEHKMAIDEHGLSPYHRVSFDINNLI